MLEKTRDNEIHVEMVEEPPAKSIAFGLEKLGLIPMKAPILSCIILAILMVGAVIGIDRIKIDDSLSQLFRSNTKEFHQYEEVTKKFPAEEFDVLAVVEGKNLLARGNLDKLRPASPFEIHASAAVEWTDDGHRTPVKPRNARGQTT